jgi:hypothetical protein
MTGVDDAARLAINAALLRSLVASDNRVTANWRTAGIGPSVDVVRSQLAPILDRVALRASYGREARRAGRSAAWWLGTGAATALELAYAMRWTELANGRRSAPFADVLERSRAARSGSIVGRR